MKTLLISLTLILLFASCSDNNVQVTGPIKDMLIGTWIEYETQHPVTTVIMADSLQKDKYGFIFHKDGKFTHLDPGECATPPLNYSKYYGTWTMLSDSVVRIDIDSWRGMVKFTMKILILDNNVLRYEPSRWEYK